MLLVDHANSSVDYLVPRVKIFGIPDKAFKYVNLQIGSNDLCQLCLQGEFSDLPPYISVLTRHTASLRYGPGSADDFEANIRATLEYLRLNLRGSLSPVIPDSSLISL